MKFYGIVFLIAIASGSSENNIQDGFDRATLSNEGDDYTISYKTDERISDTPQHEELITRTPQHEEHISETPQHEELKTITLKQKTVSTDAPHQKEDPADLKRTREEIHNKTQERKSRVLVEVERSGNSGTKIKSNSTTNLTIKFNEENTNGENSGNEILLSKKGKDPDFIEREVSTTMKIADRKYKANEEVETNQYQESKRSKSPNWMDIASNIERMMPALSNMLNGGKKWMSKSVLKDVNEEPTKMEKRSDKIAPTKMFHPLKSLLPDSPSRTTKYLNTSTDLPIVTTPISQPQAKSRRKKGRAWPMPPPNTQPTPVNSFSLQSSIPAILNALPFMSKVSHKKSKAPARVHLPNYPLHSSISSSMNTQNSDNDNYTNLVYYASLPDSTMKSMEHHLAIVEVPKNVAGKITLNTVHVIAPGSPSSNTLPFIPNETKSNEETPYVMVNSASERHYANEDPYLVIPYKPKTSNSVLSEIKKIMLPLRRAPKIISDLKDSFNNLRMEASEIHTTYVDPVNNEVKLSQGVGFDKQKNNVVKPSQTSSAWHYLPSEGYAPPVPMKALPKRQKTNTQITQPAESLGPAHSISLYDYKAPNPSSNAIQLDILSGSKTEPINVQNTENFQRSPKDKLKPPPLVSNDQNKDKKLRWPITKTSSNLHASSIKNYPKGSKLLGSQSAPHVVYLQAPQPQTIPEYNSSTPSTIAKYWDMLQESLPDPSSVMNYIPNPIELLEKTRSTIIKTFNKGMVEIPSFFEGVMGEISTLYRPSEIMLQPTTSLPNYDNDGIRSKRRPNMWQQNQIRGQNMPQKPTKHLKNANENKIHSGALVINGQASHSLPTTQHPTIQSRHPNVQTKNKLATPTIQKGYKLQMSTPLVNEQIIHEINPQHKKQNKTPNAIIQEGNLEYSSYAIINDENFEAVKVQKDKIPPPSHRGSAAVGGNFLNKETNELLTPDDNFLINDNLSKAAHQHAYVAHRPSYNGPTLVMFTLEDAIPLIPANPSTELMETSASEQLLAEVNGLGNRGVKQRFYKILLNDNDARRKKLQHVASPTNFLGTTYGYFNGHSTTSMPIKHMLHNTQTPVSPHEQSNLFSKLPTVTPTQSSFIKPQIISRTSPTTQTRLPQILFNQDHSFSKTRDHSFSKTSKPAQKWKSQENNHDYRHAEKFKDNTNYEQSIDQASANSETSTEGVSENDFETALIDIQKKNEESSVDPQEYPNTETNYQNQQQASYQLNHGQQHQSPYHSIYHNQNQSNYIKFNNLRQPFNHSNSYSQYQQQQPYQTTPLRQNQLGSLQQQNLRKISNNQTFRALNNKITTQHQNPFSGYPNQTTNRPVLLHQVTTSHQQKVTEKFTPSNNFMWMNKTNKEKKETKPPVSPFGFNFSNPTPTAKQIRIINKRPRPRDVSEVIVSNWPNFNIQKPKVAIEEPIAIEVDIDTYTDEDNTVAFTEISEVKWPKRGRFKFNHHNQIRTQEEMELPQMENTDIDETEDEVVAKISTMDPQSEASKAEKTTLNPNPPQDRVKKIRENKNNLLRYRRPQNDKTAFNFNSQMDQTTTTKPPSILSQMATKLNPNAKETGKTPLDFLSRMRNRKRVSPMPEYKPTTTEITSSETFSHALTFTPSINAKRSTTQFNLPPQQLLASKVTPKQVYESAKASKLQPFATSTWQTSKEDVTLSQIDASVSQKAQRKPIQSVLLQDSPKSFDVFDWEFYKMTNKNPNTGLAMNVSNNKYFGIEIKDEKEDGNENWKAFVKSTTKPNYDQEFSSSSRHNKTENKTNAKLHQHNLFNLFESKKNEDQSFNESISYPSPVGTLKKDTLPSQAFSMYNTNHLQVIKTPSYTSINIASGMNSET